MRLRLESGMGMRGVGLVLLVACAAGALGQAAPAQDGQAAALQTELQKLGAAALSLQHDLPDFECQETGLSQALKKGKVKAQVRFVATVRVERAAAGRLGEDLEVSAVNGKPPSGRFDPPFMVGGGFGESLFFFLPTTQACFRYSLSQGRIDFESPPGTFDRPQCTNTGAPRGFALLDVAGNAKHLERQVPHENAEQVHVVDFTAIDFVATELDGKVYPLTAKMVADVPKEEGVTFHFEATYTGCHLFKATSRILPGETVVPDAGTPHP
ncbi:MAG: hypothetical protein ABSG84_13020 [Acidobacteriaceae bacterium]